MKQLVLVAILALSRGAAADPQPAATQPAATTPAALQQQCRDALNNDPVFRKSITDKIDETRIEQTIVDTHAEAYRHVQKNEAHVIYAYAAMWVIAALFVIFLFVRQQGLVAEIRTLRRDLEAAGKDGGAA